MLNDTGETTLTRLRTKPEVVSAVSRVRSLARRFLVVTLVAVGALCGLIAVAFEKYVEAAREVLIGAALGLDEPMRSIVVVLTPTVVFTLIALVVSRFAPRAIGANLARVRMAYNEDPKLLRPRSVAATAALTPISLAAGAPLGPEGPIVVITSGVSAAVGRVLKLPRKLVRGMIPVGVAAGIAAIFNTPITGVVFALEEVFGAPDRGLLGGVLLGAVAAAVVERLLLGGRPLLAAPFSTWGTPRDLLGFVVVGVIAGLVSGLTIAAAHRLKRRWARLMPSMVGRAAVAGLLVGGAGLITPSVLGVGYGSVSYWLHGGGTAQSTAIAFVVKTVAFVIAISGGVLGGSFAPSLFIGTALGASIGHSMHMLFPAARLDPKAFAIVGMGSVFAGLLRNPIAAVLIVVELTRDYELIVPLMLGVSLAVAISRRLSRFSIVEQQMIDEGYVEGHDSADPLSKVVVRDAMSRRPLTLGVDAPLRAAVDTASHVRYQIFPVVDGQQNLIGIVTRDALQGRSDSDGKTVVRELMEQPKLVALADDDLIEIVRRMELYGVDRCPVLGGENDRKLIGFLSPSDILRARIARARPAEEEIEFDLFER